MIKKISLIIKKDAFLIVFGLFIILHISLIYSLRLYPFIDLPNHLAEATIFKFYGMENNEFSDFYTVNIFPKPNIFHFIFCSLNIFPSVEMGNKIFYCIYLILFPMSILLVIKKLDGNPWFSILSFLLIYNYNVSCGLVGFTISIPFVILLIYFLIDRESNFKKKAIIAFLFLLLFTMHVLSTVYAILIYFLITLIRNRKSPVNFLKEITPAIPVILIIIIWWLKDSAGGGGTFQFLYDYYREEYLKTFFKRAGLFMFDNYFLYEGLKGVIISFLFSLFITVPAVSLLIFKRKEVTEYIEGKYIPLYIFILTAFLSFLLLPDRIPGNWCLYERFSVYFLISVIILVGIMYKNAGKTWVLLICIISFLHFILWAGYFTDFQKENFLFRKDLFPRKTEGKRLAGLITDNKFRGKPVYIHFPNYYIIWKKGIGATMIIDYRFGPIRRKEGKGNLPSYMDIVLKQNFKEFKNINYILIRGKLPSELEIRPLRIKGPWISGEINNKPGEGEHKNER